MATCGSAVSRRFIHALPPTMERHLCPGRALSVAGIWDDAAKNFTQIGGDVVIASRTSNDWHPLQHEGDYRVELIGQDAYMFPVKNGVMSAVDSSGNILAQYRVDRLLVSRSTKIHGR